MNLFDLGGQFLRVGKAITPPENVINPALAPLPTAIPINQPKAAPAVETPVNPTETVILLIIIQRYVVIAMFVKNCFITTIPV